MLGHPKNPGFLLTSGKGFQVLLANGMTVSVQWGAGNYCRNHSCATGSFNQKFDSCEDAETAVWDKDGNWIKRTADVYDTVQGRQSPDDVVATLAWAASLP